MHEKVQKLLDRLKEIEKILGDPNTFSDQKLYKELTQEHSRLLELQDAWNYFDSTYNQLQANKELLITEKDPEMIQIIKEDIQNLEAEIQISQKNLEMILVPPDPHDSRNVIMEIRAGTGGEEAALFAA